jgi:uncharacterized protein YndB with AHSA1/START domain
MITWRIHFSSSPGDVYRMLSTDDGRAQFWAESAIEHDGIIHFRFPNGYTWAGEILEAEPDRRFSVRYFDGDVSFELLEDGSGGTDLTLTDAGRPVGDREEVHAGWVSVLMTFKAATDFKVDLRNHDPARSWDQGYADN